LALRDAELKRANSDLEKEQGISAELRGALDEKNNEIRAKDVDLQKAQQRIESLQSDLKALDMTIAELRTQIHAQQPVQQEGRAADDTATQG
jgi:chromosome segregation ATPase